MTVGWEVAAGGADEVGWGRAWLWVVGWAVGGCGEEVGGEGAVEEGIWLGCVWVVGMAGGGLAWGPGRCGLRSCGVEVYVASVEGVICWADAVRGVEACGSC